MSLRILFLSHKFYPDIGGIETSSTMLAHAFTAAGHVVRVMTWSPDVTETIFPFVTVRNPTFITILKHHAWADIVFENNLCLRLAWPRLLFKSKSIIVLHTWLSRTDGRVGWIDKLKAIWLTHSSCVVAISEAVRQRCFTQALVIPNPYQEDIFRIDTLASRDKTFVFLGRLVSDKGVDLAIQALYQLIDKSKHLENMSDLQPTLTIIGDGPERDNLENSVYELSLSDRVTFTGSLQGEELVKCLNQHKILLIPSRWEEPFGIVALEGMACGCIPIVSDGGGLPNAVGQAGITFKRNDIFSLASKMELLLQKPELIDHYLQNAKEHLFNHSLQIISEKYLARLESVFNT